MKKVKGSLHHLKRSKSPKFWPISRKEAVWSVKPRAGPHPLHRAIPLGIVIRDMLGYANNMREARKILGQRLIEVDGRVVTDYKFPVGLMDVIHIKPSDEYFRVVPDRVRLLRLVKINSDESSLKILRIEKKTMVKGGNIQLTFHDGRNYLLRIKNPFEPEEDIYSTFDSVLYNLNDKEIVDHYPFKEGYISVVIDGSNVGVIGKIKNIRQIFKKVKAQVEIEDAEGGITRTILGYVLIVGKDKPTITLG
ncbi:MAG: 30S ribosomal protein S4e [Thermoproteales archaeon]|nr:30S ribosomal protein S4e [Thermoproteales archaeon]